MPSTVGAPLIPDLLNGSGTANTFQVIGAGVALEGGAWDWNDVCGGCLIRVGVRDGAFVLSDASNAATTLTPGVYELREFSGLFAFTAVAPREFDVQIHGIGKINKIG